MEILNIIKALGNPTRLQILKWLQAPEDYFPDQQEPLSTGVCVGQMQKVGNLPVSTISEHLMVLQKAGILSSEKKGQWVYYKRNDDLIAEFLTCLNKHI
ncbi:ArsR/SmtB family transcription factor [Mucilaginibacter jinjuensis]|uniref:Metalloregulator ArsR/SmtB family transcription factor n=1 Tax=Mucilaginibacter jinjuensis TaxID=1176721 RepID=A0ABY7TCC2_9SPHI|nr:metalloregulator ArsR/SmtB family transcription factor [Mucilaginibacter jinjuensis]WCT13358.1 metalloregulator ArsR/SmtB family transcription factor [Mucilaginibacter jinjuensis]